MTDHPVDASIIPAIPGVWIDTDVALGAPSGDVDDGFAIAALLAAHRKRRVRILGLSTVAGNTSAARAEECARELCRLGAVSIPVLRGAEKPEQPTPASEAITAVGDGAEVLCLGPLTNVAEACRRDPGLPARVCLSAVGGTLFSRGFLPPLWPFEFNFFRDGKSARFVLSRDWKRMTLFPLDVVRRLAVDRNRLGELAEASPMGSYLARESLRWLAGRRGFPLWDLPAALDIAGALAGTRQMRVLAPGARWLLRMSRPVSCLASFDPAEAWRRFRQLLDEC